MRTIEMTKQCKQGWEFILKGRDGSCYVTVGTHDLEPKVRIFSMYEGKIFANIPLVEETLADLPASSGEAALTALIVSELI